MTSRYRGLDKSSFLKCKFLSIEINQTEDLLIHLGQRHLRLLNRIRNLMKRK